MKRGNKQTAFLLSVFVITALALFTLQVGFTGHAISEDWCQGADINQDGTVDGEDEEIFMNYYPVSNTASLCPNEECYKCDLDNDGDIDLSDLSIIGNNRGNTDCKIITSTEQIVGFNSACEQALGECLPIDASNIEGLTCAKNNRKFLDKSCNNEYYECCGEEIETQTIQTACEEKGYTCRDYNLAADETLTKEQVCGSLDVSNLDCGINKVCCKPKIETCESLTYTTCGNQSMTTLENSCVLAGLDYAERTNLDSGCDPDQDQLTKYGCCCKYGYNDASGTCYTYKQTSTPDNPDEPNNPSNNGGSNYNNYDSGKTLSANDLKYGERVELKRIGYVKFEIDGENHKLQILSLSNSIAKIKITSKTFETYFNIGDINKYDLDGNNYYDLQVKLNDIDNRVADLTIKEINEKVTTKTQSSQKSSDTNAKIVYEDETGEDAINEHLWIYIVGAIGLLLIFVLLLLFLAYKRKQRYTYK